MSENENKGKEEPVSKWQSVFDNIWLLFLLSMLISGVIYNAWGIYDLMNVPLAP
jgi:zona occludens toxin (predicted ATPase)